jgi:SpoVK/Ycf46/Vps4 family AAA+-type ATPase
VVEEIRPRYLQRVMADMLDDSAKYLQEEDVPFEKLVSGSSAFDESIRELNEMIGLDTVKQGIMTMANQARLFSERQRRGLHTSNKMIFHSVFTGNPGTGKTTVARKLGKIYRSLGLLSKGEVIAVDRTRLVGQYLGQTEDNMKVILEEAKGNVLFIDEAYNLNTGSDDRKDFGYRVLDSLLTVLTQPNPDMLIIFAGYEKEMDDMLNSNPGLQGRFPYRYQFDDYSAEQLMEIALKIFERDEYILTDEAAAEMQDDIAQMLNQKLPNFGNARWVEQFVNNGIIPAMADRIYSSDASLSAGDTDLRHIEASDVSKAFEKFKPAPIDLKSTRHRVKGFRA